MKVGDTVVIKTDGSDLIKKGDKAKLVKGFPDGAWIADFTMNDRYTGDGLWTIYKNEFELVKRPFPFKACLIYFARTSIFVAIWTIVFSLIRFVFELPPNYAWGYVAIAIGGFCMYPLKTWIDGVVK
jgi:hypothetical protein